MFLSGFSGNLLALFRRQLLGSRSSASLAAQLTERNGGGVPFVLNAALDLFGRDVADKLRQLDGIARAFEALRSHAAILLSSANHSDNSGLARSLALSFSRVAAARRIPVLPDVLQRNSGFLARRTRARE